MSRPKQVLRERPLPSASSAGVPPLDPSDLASVPRWLDELYEASEEAEYSMSTYDESAHLWTGEAARCLGFAPRPSPLWAKLEKTP